MEKLTQEKVNEVFKEIKAAWDARVATSGRSEKMFVALDTTGFVVDFMYNYQLAKEHVESEGLVMPELIEGLIVNIPQGE